MKEKWAMSNSESNKLKTRHLTMMGLGSAIGAGLFLGVGVGIQIAGTSILIAYLVAGVLVTLIMYMLGEMASARPSLGSFSTYAGQAFGNWARFTMGWLYWFMLIMVMGAEITGAAAILGGWFGVDPWIPALVAVVFFAVVNFGAVRGFGEFEFWFAIIKVAVIVAFLVLGAWLILAQLRLKPAVSLRTSRPMACQVWQPVCWRWPFAFGGIELVTIAAAESEDPAQCRHSSARDYFPHHCLLPGAVAVITLLLPFSRFKTRTLQRSLLSLRFCALQRFLMPRPSWS